MADWTAVVTDAPKPDGNMIGFTVEFRKTGKTPRSERFRVDRFSLEWFKGFIREKLQTLNFQHQTDLVTLGVIDVTPEVPVIDAAREAYFNDLILWRRLKTVGEFRPAILSTAQFTNCVTRLRDNFQPSFLDMV